MNLSFRWLSELVAHGLEPEALAHVLTFRACPVEGTETLPDGDVRIGLEVTFNRPDLLSHHGVARELSGATGAPFEPAEPAPKADAGCPAARCASVAVEAADLCPRYTARVIRGVTVRESPAWLKARLEAVGIRPVNNVVDVTNLVLMERGQPLHAFDLATLAGSQIVVRRAWAGERFAAIDRSEHQLTPETLVIADARRPVAIAGIMGGLDTEISERTRDVLLESAYFDPVATRRAVRRLNLRSDSSYRFERGVDPAEVERASRRAAELILEVAGGTLCAGVLDADAGTLPGPRKVSLRLHRLRMLAGVEISRKQAAHALAGLGFGVVETDETLEVTVPTGRAEVAREVDLVEEALRAFGYDKVPLTPSFPVRVAKARPRDRAIGRVKRLLAGAGFREILSLSFVERDDAIDPPAFTDAAPLTIRNPVQPEIPALRRSLFGPLLHARRANLDAGNRGVRLFEVGLAYLPRPGDQPDERLHLGLIADEGFLDVKGAVEAVFAELGLAPGFAPSEANWLHPVEQAEVREGGRRAGAIGKLAAARAATPRAKALYEGLRPGQSPVVALLDLDALIAAAEAAQGLQRRHRDLPQFPPVTRDLAVVVDAERLWQEIADAVSSIQVEHLRRFDYIQGSVFEGAEGKPVPAGKKSIALTLEFRADDRTLTGEEADRGREAVKAALRERLGATFRE